MILLGDLHLGARNGSSHFSTYFNKFFTDVLFPYMKKNKITHIIQLGDLFDNRTNLSYKAFHACKDIWFKQMGEHGFTMEVLIGNHDTTYRHTLEINSPELLLGEYKHIDVITSATQKNYDGMNIDIIHPWDTNPCHSSPEAEYPWISDGLLRLSLNVVPTHPSYHHSNYDRQKDHTSRSDCRCRCAGRTEPTNHTSRSST